MFAATCGIGQLPIIVAALGVGVDIAACANAGDWCAEIDVEVGRSGEPAMVGGAVDGGADGGALDGEMLLLASPSAAGVCSDSLFFFTPRVELSFRPILVALINI